MKLKEKLAYKGQLEWNCRLSQRRDVSKPSDEYEQGFIAGFETARKLYREKLQETLTKLRKPEDKSAIFTAIAFNVDIGEEEV